LYDVAADDDEYGDQDDDDDNNDAIDDSGSYNKKMEEEDESYFSKNYSRRTQGRFVVFCRCLRHGQRPQPDEQPHRWPRPTRADGPSSDHPRHPEHDH
jgi:hypothetical protein